jgi:hypothetical protein
MGAFVLAILELYTNDSILSTNNTFVALHVLRHMLLVASKACKQLANDHGCLIAKGGPLRS